MQIINQNPALLLRDRALEVSLPGFLRWDASGRALLVSDAPRHAPVEAQIQKIEASGAVCFVNRHLLYIDITEDAYQKMADQTFLMPGPWIEPYIAIQSRLSGILSRDRAPAAEPADIPPLRAAMLSCARGLPCVSRYVDALPGLDAVGLRKKQTRTLHACAALCAHYMYTQKKVGLPFRAKTERWGPAENCSLKSEPPI